MQNQTVTENINNILKEFDDKFDGIWLALSDWAGDGKYHPKPKEEIKSFISTTIQKEIERERREIVEECEKIDMTDKTTGGFRRDVINIIKNKR